MTIEQKAKEVYPIHPMEILPEEDENGKIINFDEWLDDFRLSIQSFSLNKGYQEGYEQAEKDYALTWKDIRQICTIAEDLFDDSYDSYEDYFKLSDEEFFSKILKQFKLIDKKYESKED